MNPGQSVWGVAAADELLAFWLTERESSLLLLGTFSLVALCLAAVGIYGVVSYSVERRVAELGVRKAVGGHPRAILAMVLKEGILMAGAGAVLGVLGSLALTRFLRGMLFAVTPTDPVTIAVAVGGVLAVAMLATLRPALRAVRIDPAEVLRNQ